MNGFGSSGGALSIVNAISSGFGGAFGIMLSTRAQVAPSEDLSLTINGVPSDTRFLSCLLHQFNAAAELPGAAVSVTSSIPPCVGLKSSSAAGNAILLAFCNLLSIELTDEDILSMNAAASIEAGVSVTGAYDDAAACLLGGAVLTDNAAMRILRRGEMPETLQAFIVLPPQEDGVQLSTAFPRDRLNRDDSLAVFETAMTGDVMTAIRDNGKLVADALEISNEIADAAMDAGAVTAGISGTGPAVGILVEDAQVPAFLNAFPYTPAITTRIRNRRL